MKQESAKDVSAVYTVFIALMAAAVSCPAASLGDTQPTAVLLLMRRSLTEHLAYLTPTQVPLHYMLAVAKRQDGD